MEKTSKHTLLNSVLFTALAIPVIFFILRDLIAVLLGLLIEMTAGQDSFLYAIYDDVARLAIAGLLMLVMPLYFRGTTLQELISPGEVCQGSLETLSVTFLC